MNLYDLKIMESLGLASKKECTKEENATYRAYIKEKKKLPENIVIANEEKSRFYKISKVKDDVKNEKLFLRQVYYTKIIKNIMVFILIVLVVYIVLSFVGALIGVSQVFNYLQKVSSFVN